MSEKEQLSNLVDLLNSNELYARAIGFERLKLLTGKKLGFKPTISNRTSILAWRRDLATDNLQAGLPPTLIVESAKP